MNIWQFRDWQYLIPVYVGMFLIGMTGKAVYMGDVSPWWYAAGILPFMILSVENTVGMHRLFCHRSFTTSRWHELHLLIVGTLSMYGSSIQWNALHRRHHLHADTALDTHQIHTVMDIFRPSYFMEAFDRRDVRMSKKLLRDPWHCFAHKWYWLINIMFMSLLYAISWKVLVFCYLLPLGVYIFLGTTFNLMTHRPDGIRNSWFWALVFSGEGYHRNHHERPKDWRMADKPWQPDLGAWVISRIRTDG